MWWVSESDATKMRVSWTSESALLSKTRAVVSVLKLLRRRIHCEVQGRGQVFTAYFSG